VISFRRARKEQSRRGLFMTATKASMRGVVATGIQRTNVVQCRIRGVVAAM